jgi:uncharacterized protein YecE (DUF72 family)
MLKYYVGCSGWYYEHWCNTYYPRGLTRTKWLHHYSRDFPTVEINNSFYRLPSEKSFTNWKDSVPDDFVFSVKASRYVTHIKRLKDSASAVNTFVSRAHFLGSKLGPLLYQLPPNMRRDDRILEDFLAALPQGYYHVLEFRHRSWFDDAVFRLLRRYNVGVCVFDMLGFISPLVATSNLAYIRFHGSARLYSSYYSEEELSRWATDILLLGKQVEVVYIYFNNDAEAFAVRNALTLRRLLEQ